MKHVFKRILFTVIAVIMAIGAFAVAACGSDDNKLVKLEIENARTAFSVGDEFEYGEGFTVWAVYADNSKKNVTDEASITKEATFDMDVAGDYQITVRYGGLIADYKIYVADFEDVLRKISIDSSGVKKDYDLGEEISFDGIKLICTYENAQGKLVEKEITSVKDFSVEIKHSDGTVLENRILNSLGKYTVTISSGAVKDAYEVAVTNVDLSSIEGALAAGTAFRSEVVSGTELVDASLHGTTETYHELNYTYEFGNNYTFIKENQSEKEELHLSLNADGTLFCTRILDGEQVPINYTDKTMMNGAPFFLWYQSHRAYGVEDAIANLYENGQSATNGDLKMSYNIKNEEYSFSYSGLHFGFNVNAADYYETKVTFRLGEKYNIEYAVIEQGYWENNANFGEDGSIVVQPTTFVTDPETGKTTPLVKVSKQITITVNQTTGPRVKSNPYTVDDSTVISFDLKYNNEILENGATITTTMGSGSRLLYIDIENILPATANFTNDALKFSLEGSHLGAADSSTGYFETGFQAYRTKNRIMISFEHGGEWTLIMRTKRVEKRINFSVKGVPPTSMNTFIYNSLSEQFYRATDATMMEGSSLIFYGEVNEYANTDQVVGITSSNANSAKIEETEVKGISCFKFSATQAGVYSIKITSTSNKSVSCELKITVIAAPDMEKLLTGKYTATDVEGSVFEVTFTPQNTDGKICGKVEIKKTLLDEDNNLDTANAVTQILYYEVKDGGYEIVMEGVSGENLGALLRIDTSTCDLVIEDQYGLCYKLEKVN